ncbi:RNA polymerase sigma factor [Gottfriedia acidiceleris]|uniref:RNA polymerase sigma factor n=1 Tax=Gottfriedia acidiceleris TaxID=371036 RepID=UPI00101D30EC|nr:RNA polymerase sigma factor [Gottfriedia acidiceleris]
MENETLEEIYEAYAKEVSRYLFSISLDYEITEEVVQETFFRAFLQIEKLRSEQMKPWLFKVAYNLFIDKKRKEKRLIHKDLDSYDVANNSLTIEEQLLMKERLQSILINIRELPEKQKNALLLVSIHHFTYEQTAQVMGISESNVKILIFRARQTLRNNERGNGNG